MKILVDPSPVAPDPGIVPNVQELELDESTVLSGRGVVLRTWQPEDADDLLRACQDEDTQRWTTLPSPYLPEHAEHFLDTCALRWVQGLATFAIVDAAGTELLGSIGFVGIPEEGVVEVGFWIAPHARARGVATAATRLICDWALDVLAFHRVEWQSYVGNDGSRRVADKCGFSFEGTLRGRGFQRGVARDIWIGGLLSTDPRPDVADAR